MKLLFITALLFFIAESIASATGFSVLNHFENAKNKLMKKHLDNIHSNATSLSHYEDYDNMETEYYDHVDAYKQKGFTPQRAHSSAYSKMEVKHGSAFSQAMNKARHNNGANLSHSNSNVKGQFDLVFTRNTANIIQTVLPVPIFGAIHYNARYIAIMGNFLPAGITLSGIAIDANGNVVFTYTQTSTGFTDTITVSCNQIPYITFLDGSKQNPMRVSKTLYQISDVTKLDQFANLFKTFEKGIYGKLGGNDISVSATNVPSITNFVAREVKTGMTMNYENSIILGISAYVGFKVTLSMDISQYKRSDLQP